ncbi:MAG: Major Facilitator Superfamily transporter [Bacteroidetes bacterium]|nr:MAG: Major Facilitator Superfamily transporter [Bacteroidota bacterium]
MTKSFLTRNIILLSLISLFNDLAGEMLYPILPLYLESVGFSVLWIGLLEGMAEAISGISKSYFGKLSDRSGKRVPFIRIGYAMSAFSKPMLILFRFAPYVLFMRTVDRLGKGVRTGARDALLSDESAPENRGKVFGFHRAMDTLGAVLGPTVALAWLLTQGDKNLEPVFWFAAIPGAAGIILTFLIREQRKEPKIKTGNGGFFSFFSYWKIAKPEYKKIVAALGVFFLLNSSDVFLLLLVKKMGFGTSTAVLLYILYNCTYVIVSYPAGRLADKIGMKKMLLSGLSIFALVYVIGGFLFFFSQPAQINLVLLIAAFALYGIYAACSDGVAKAWLSKTCEKSDSAQAMGLFSGVQSLGALAASSIAGLLWTFDTAGAGTSLLLTAGAALFSILLLRRIREGA